MNSLNDEIKQRIVAGDCAVEELLASTAEQVVAPSQCDPINRVRRLAAKARQSYVNRGVPVPPHVLSVLLPSEPILTSPRIILDRLKESSHEQTSKMRNVYEVLREKEMELARLEKEVEALRVVAPLLTENACPTQGNTNVHAVKPISDETFMGTNREAFHHI